MKTQQHLAPRGGILDLDPDRPRAVSRGTGRGRRLAAGTGLVLAALLAACSPSPGGSGAASAVALPSIDASAAASAAAGAALSALDQVGAAITANQTSNKLTADEASSLTQLSTGVRTALDNLSTKVDSFASKLTGADGTQLTSAITALKNAIPAS
jgi:hypothetical protein